MGSGNEGGWSRINLVIALILLILTLLPAGITGGSQVADRDTKILCSFKGANELYGMILTRFDIYGPKGPQVGDPLVVFLTLVYVGEESPVTLDKIAVAAQLPDGSIKEYEDKSLKGKNISSGETIETHIEIELTMEGEWIFWPVFSYHYKGKSVESKDTWDECHIKVFEKEATTTTTTPRPDIAFYPYTTLPPIGYTSCEGFKAHIMNIGDAPIPYETYTLFKIKSKNTGTTWTFRIETPPLDEREDTYVYTGPFIGVPGHVYEVKVQLDYGDMVTDERSEFNNERSVEIPYSTAYLPKLNIKIKDAILINDSLYFKVENTGCINTPPLTVHLDILGAGALDEHGDVASIQVPVLEPGEEMQLNFSNISGLIEQTGLSMHIKLRVRIDPIQEIFIVEGRWILVDESILSDNVVIVGLGGAPVIPGPSAYFIPKGLDHYTIDNAWIPVSLSEAPGAEITVTYSIEGCNANASQNPYNPYWIDLDIPPNGCPNDRFILVITAEENGMSSTRDIDIYLYELEDPEPARDKLVSRCVPQSILGVYGPFVFTDIPILIPYKPTTLFRPYTYISVAQNGEIQYETVYPTIDVYLEWNSSGGVREYHIPQHAIDLDARAPSGIAISFTIPGAEVFGDTDLMAISGFKIRLAIHPASKQEINKEYRSVWLHNGVVLPSYERSFHFGNTLCPRLTWDMWEQFWGADAVYDYVLDYRIGNDTAMELLYNIFSKMCDVGRCSGYALVSAKFNIPGLVRVEGGCSGSVPRPFTLPLDAMVYMNEDPSRSFHSHRIDLDTYITYQYMYSLDDRNIFHGIRQLEKWIKGEDAIGDIVEELLAWQRQPDTPDKWDNIYLLFMFSKENIENSHTVLVYRVEVVDSNHVRAWVVDSNRPFQPNGETNQKNSHADFYCCDSNGNWYFEFYLDDGPNATVIDDFAFITPASMLQGESNAFTEADAMETIATLLDNILELYESLGAVSGGYSGGNEPGILIITGDTRINLTSIEDMDGRPIATLWNIGEVDTRDLSPYAIQVPIILPMSTPSYIFLTSTPVKMTLTAMNDGEANIALQGEAKTLSITYQAKKGKQSVISLKQDLASIIKPNPGGKYTITFKILDEDLYREFTITSNSTTEPIEIDFSRPEEVKIMNRGSSIIAIDIKVRLYDKTGEHVRDYKRISISPGDTITAVPESWMDLENSNLILSIDKGSDGTIDEKITHNTSTATKPAEVSTESEKKGWLLEELPVDAKTLLLILMILLILVLLRKRK